MRMQNNNTRAIIGLRYCKLNSMFELLTRLNKHPDILEYQEVIRMISYVRNEIMVRNKINLPAEIIFWATDSVQILGTRFL